MARWYDENRDIEDVCSWLLVTSNVFGIDEKTKADVHKILSSHLLNLYRESPVEIESLAQIWSKSGKGVLVRNTTNGEPFTLAAEFNDGMSVRYILNRTDKTSMLVDADAQCWSIIF